MGKVRWLGIVTAVVLLVMVYRELESLWLVAALLFVYAVTEYRAWALSRFYGYTTAELLDRIEMATPEDSG